MHVAMKAKDSDEINEWVFSDTSWRVLNADQLREWQKMDLMKVKSGANRHILRKQHRTESLVTIGGWLNPEPHVNKT